MANHEIKHITLSLPKDLVNEIEQFQSYPLGTRSYVQLYKYLIKKGLEKFKLEQTKEV